MLEALKSYVTETYLDDSELLSKYVSLAWNGQGSPPSGADLIAQRHGGLCFYHKAARKLEVLAWPFSDLSFGLIHTGNKLATHAHLQTLPSMDGSKLGEIALLTVESLNAMTLPPLLILFVFIPIVYKIKIWLLTTHSIYLKKSIPCRSYKGLRGVEHLR